MTQLEVSLATALRIDGDDGKGEDEDKDVKMYRNLSFIVASLCTPLIFAIFYSRQTFDGTTPPHFYGELAKTEEGCQLLREKGHFREFADFVREHKHEKQDPATIAKLKSVLWALVSK